MLSPNHRLYAFICICIGIFVSSAIGAIIWGPLGGITLPAPLLALSFIIRRMFLPHFSGQTRIRLASIALLYATTALYFAPSNPLSTFVLNILSDISERMGGGNLNDPLIFNLLALSIVSATIIILNVVWE